MNYLTGQIGFCEIRTPLTTYWRVDSVYKLLLSRQPLLFRYDPEPAGGNLIHIVMCFGIFYFIYPAWVDFGLTLRSIEVKKFHKTAFTSCYYEPCGWKTIFTSPTWFSNTAQMERSCLSGVQISLSAEEGKTLNRLFKKNGLSSVLGELCFKLWRIIWTFFFKGHIEIGGWSVLAWLWMTVNFMVWIPGKL